MSKLSPLDLAALILIVVGGLNWGLVGIFDFDLVAAIFGEMSVLARIVYVLVGISAAYAAVRSPHLALVNLARSSTSRCQADSVGALADCTQTFSVTQLFYALARQFRSLRIQRKTRNLCV